ncbi:MAG: sigma-70 family RNA polymerase sigma factor [Planctomycetota bacterium]
MGDLVREAGAGDPTAYDRLATAFFEPLVCSARKVLGDHHLAQDVAQEALLRAHRGLRRLSDPEQFGSWVLRIGHNIAVDRVRKTVRSREVELLDPNSVGESQSGDQPRAEREGRAPASAGRTVLWDAVASMSPRDQKLLLLRFGRGLTQRQVAAECGLSLQVVKVALTRSRVRLQRLMATEYEYDFECTQGHE